MPRWRLLFVGPALGDTVALLMSATRGLVGRDVELAVLERALPAGDGGGARAVAAAAETGTLPAAVRMPSGQRQAGGAARGPLRARVTSRADDPSL